jgi:cytoskeletal protein CcmA (bactofilin family)
LHNRDQFHDGGGPRKSPWQEKEWEGTKNQAKIKNMEFTLFLPARGPFQQGDTIPSLVVFLCVSFGRESLWTTLLSTSFFFLFYDGHTQPPLGKEETSRFPFMSWRAYDQEVNRLEEQRLINQSPAPSMQSVPQAGSGSSIFSALQALTLLAAAIAIVVSGVAMATTKTTSAGPQGIPGKNGTDGRDGANGTNGLNGMDGLNGTDGLPGRDGLNGTDGLPGRDGLNGTDGLPGRDGLNGTDGLPGRDGLNGTDGLPGRDGLNGTDGLPGRDGLNGTDGLNGSNATCSSCVLNITVSNNTAFISLDGSILYIQGDDPHSMTLEFLGDGLVQVPTSGELTAGGNVFTGTGALVRQVGPQLSGSVLLEDTLRVKGNASFGNVETNGTLIVGGTANVATLHVTGSGHVEDNLVVDNTLSTNVLRVDQNADFAGPVNIETTIRATGTANFNAVVANGSLNVLGPTHLFQSLFVDGSFVGHDITTKSVGPTCNFLAQLDNVDACQIQASQINANGDVFQNSGGYTQLSAGPNQFATTTFTDSVTFSFGVVEFDTVALFTQPVTIQSTVDVQGPVDVEGSLRATGPALFNNVQANGTVTTEFCHVHQSSQFDGPVNVDATLRATGLATFNNVQVNGTFEVDLLHVHESVQVDGPVNVDGTLRATGLATFNNVQANGTVTTEVLRVHQESQLDGPLNVASTLRVTGPATFNNVEVNGTLRVHQSTQMDGPLNVDGTLRATGLVTFNDVQINGTATTEYLRVHQVSQFDGPVNMAQTLRVAGPATFTDVAVNNTLTTHALDRNVVRPTSSPYTVLATDDIVLVGVAACIVTLPASPAEGRTITVLDGTGGASASGDFIIIDGNGNPIGEGGTFEIYSNYGYATLAFSSKSGSGAWYIVDSSTPPDMTSVVTPYLQPPADGSTLTISFDGTSYNADVMISADTFTTTIQSSFVSMPNRVRFQATLASDTEFISTGDFQTIVFDSIIFNVGSAYDSGTGTFTAPAAGTYMFSCSMLVNFCAGTVQFIISFASSNPTYDGYRVYQTGSTAATDGQASGSGAAALMDLEFEDTITPKIFILGCPTPGSASITVKAGLGLATAFWGRMVG